MTNSLKLVVLTLLMFLWFRPVAADETNQLPQGNRTKVEVVELRPRILKSHATYVGNLDAVSNVTVSSEFAGIVSRVNFDLGLQVKAGRVLVQIDTERLLLNKKLNQSNYELALKDYNRERKLLNKNLSTPAKVANLKNKLEVNKLRLDLSELDLTRSKIRAPISGIVKSKEIETGEYIRVGTKLLEIYDISRVLAVIHIPEKDIRFSRPGKRVLVSVDAFPKLTFIGEIKNRALEADPKSRSFEMEVLVDNPDETLLPGMLARVKMLKVYLKNQIIIPRHTIQESETGSFVYVVNDSKVIKRDIELGLSVDDEVQVVSGLSFNEQLVNTGHQLISPDEIVTIIKSSVQD